MTVREWLATRKPLPPAPLTDRILEALGDDAHAPASDATELFLSTSRSLLGDIVRQERFARDGALDLLVADALMTYAFEHASEQASHANALGALASRAAGDVARLAGMHG